MGKRVPPPGSTSPSIVPSYPLLLLPPGAWPQPPLDFSPPANLPLQLPLCSYPSSAIWPLMPTPAVLSFLRSHHFPIHADCGFHTELIFSIKAWELCLGLCREHPDFSLPDNSGWSAAPSLTPYLHGTQPLGLLRCDHPGPFPLHLSLRS